MQLALLFQPCGLCIALQGDHQNYKDLDKDLAYFGTMNSLPVLQLLTATVESDWGVPKAPFHTMNFVNDTMGYLVRLPYTNAWRVQDIQADCPSCTVRKIA